MQEGGVRGGHYNSLLRSHLLRGLLCNCFPFGIQFVHSFNPREVMVQKRGIWVEVLSLLQAQQVFDE